MNLINIGFGNMVNEARIIAVISPDSAPAKRIVGEAKNKNILIDATQGRKTKAVIIMDTDHVVLSYMSPELIMSKNTEAV